MRNGGGVMREVTPLILGVLIIGLFMNVAGCGGDDDDSSDSDGSPPDDDTDDDHDGVVHFPSSFEYLF